MSRILIAPMEVLADGLLLGVLTDIRGHGCAICESVRASAPAKTFQRICPEALNGSTAAAGMPGTSSCWVPSLSDPLLRGMQVIPA